MKILMFLLLSIVSLSSYAEISATASLKSNYVWHGQPLSDSAVVEGSIDYAHESGLYAGLWTASYTSVDKDPNSTDVGTSSATNEIDYYLGYDYSFNDDFSAGVLFTRFTYTTPDAQDYTEMSANLAYKFLTFTYSYYAEYDGVEDDGEAHYFKLAGEYEIDEKNTVAAHVGYTSIDKRIAIGYNSHIDYLLGYYRKIEGFKVGAEYTDTSRDDYDASTSMADGTDLKDQRMTFLVSKTF